MGRPRKPEYLKKESKTISLSAWLKWRLDKEGNASALVESLLLEYYKDVDKNEKK